MGLKPRKVGRIPILRLKPQVIDRCFELIIPKAKSNK